MDNINGQNILLNKLGKHQSALVADYNREYGIHGHKSPGSIILKTNDHAKWEVCNNVTKLTSNKTALENNTHIILFSH